MNDKDKKERIIRVKTKAWLLAVLAACGVIKYTYDKINQINENDLPEKPTLEEAQDEIRKFIEKETEIDPNEISFEDQENELEKAENQNTEEKEPTLPVFNKTNQTVTKPKEIKPVPKKSFKEEIKKTENVQTPKEMEMPTITYNPPGLTNGNVIVTISAKEKIKPLRGWTLLEDGKTLTREYTTNTDETVRIHNLNDVGKTVRILIQYIDKTFNEVKVTYKTLTNGNVLATITSEEELRPLKGWTFSKKSLSKEYTKTINEEITIFDIANNSQKITIDVKIENKTNEFTSKDNDKDKEDDQTQLKPEPTPAPEDREEDKKDEEDGSGLTEGEEDDIIMGGGKTEDSNSQVQENEKEETETEKQTEIQALYELREIVLQNGLVFEYDVPVEETENVLELKL